MAAGFDALASASAQNAEAEAQARIQEKQQQRNTVAALYLNAIQTPLPKTDDPQYQAALQKREDLMKQYVAAVGPEQHASFGQRLHGLIFGEPETAQPVHGNAPTPLPPPAAGAPPPAPPVSDHPFASNPAYAKIQQGLDGLGKHLKAFAHPLPPPASPDFATLAAAPTAEERKDQQTTALEKMREEAAIERAKIAAGSKPINKYTLGLTKYAEGLGKSVNDLTDEEVQKFNKQLSAEGRAPTAPKLQHIAGNWYDYDPTTNKRTFVAKDSDTRVTQGFRFITNALTGEITKVPVTTVVSKATGKPISGSEDNPGEVFDGGAPPVSSQAPSLDNVNAGIKANPGKAGAPSRKAAAKVRSSQAPQVPGSPPGSQVVGHTTSLLDKSAAAQYTKVAEDANVKKQAYENARQALSAGSTPSSDQELIYSWVRSNVQGAGRMTQAEFRQAAATGSLPLRAQTAWQRATTGRLPPELEQEFLADIKRSSDIAQQEAATLRGRIGGGFPVSSQAPQTPTGNPKTAAEYLQSVGVQ